MSARILIAVTHLLGSGHLVRAQHLAQALAQAGHDVTLASGGMPLRRASGALYAFVQLPPVRVEGVDFRHLLDEAGRPIDRDRLPARSSILVELAARIAPDIVVTEHFPFGRRQLATEFLGLIAAAKAANPTALALSSIRDVLVTPRADRIEEAHRRIAADFDTVLVHGDAAFLPLQASWPVVPELAAKLRYTGYLAEAAGSPRSSGHDEASEPAADILVSGGGSGAALPLFELCIETARLLGPARPWRLLVGRGLAEADFERLRASGPGHVAVEWSRPDFPTLLKACALSVSQAGYNTVLDLVAAGRPAIVVPFDEGGETEQAVRAAAMQRAGIAHMIRLGGAGPGGAPALTPADLAQTIATALQAGAQRPAAIDRNGAAGSVAAIGRLLSGRLTARA